MNVEWSSLNKTMQNQIKKKETFSDGINTLLILRQELLKEVFDLRSVLKRGNFDEIPFNSVKGYYSKTIAYSLWHIFRIEDIVSHTLILEDEQVLFKKSFQERIHSPIVTTGNELFKEEIAEFSKILNLEELFNYILDVDKDTTELLKNLSYSDLRMKIPNERRKYLESLHVVSEDKNAYWLIDYWCKKDVRGLIQMPFSRHWIMHIEASLRIKNKIKSTSINPVSQGTRR